MKFVEAENRLKLTLNPKWLYVTNRAFYYIMKGSIAANLNRHDEAEAHFEKAKDLKLPSDNERALIYLQLANIKANQGKWTQAKSYFHQVKKFNITEGQLKDQVKQFEKAINQSGNMVHLRSGQAMQPGGKRRRPKMRWSPLVFAINSYLSINYGNIHSSQRKSEMQNLNSKLDFAYLRRPI